MDFTILKNAALLKTVVDSAPRILSESRRLYETIRKARPRDEPAQTGPEATVPDASKALEELRSRVSALEAHNDNQAKLITEIASHADTAAQGLQLLAKRTAAAMFLAAAAIALAASALVLAVVR